MEIRLIFRISVKEMFGRRIMDRLRRKRVGRRRMDKFYNLFQSRILRETPRRSKQDRQVYIQIKHPVILCTFILSAAIFNIWMKRLHLFFLTEAELEFQRNILQSARILEMVGYSVSFASILASIIIISAFR